MKCCLVCLPLFLVISSLMEAEVTPPSTPLISVTGTAITEVKPDQLHWSIEVRNTGPDLPKVADRHSALASTVLSVLKQLGVAAVYTPKDFDMNRIMADLVTLIEKRADEKAA